MIFMGMIVMFIRQLHSVEPSKDMEWEFYIYGTEYNSNEINSELLFFLASQGGGRIYRFFKHISAVLYIICFFKQDELWSDTKKVDRYVLPFSTNNPKMSVPRKIQKMD